MFYHHERLFLLLIGIAQASPINIFESSGTFPESQLFATVEIVLGRSDLFPVSNPVLTRVDVPLAVDIVDIGRESDFQLSGEKDLEFTYNILSGRLISSPPRVSCAIFSPAGTIERILPFDNPVDRVNGRSIFCYQLKDSVDNTYLN